MAKLIIFIVFFVLGIFGGFYLKNNATTPADFALDTTGHVVNEIQTKNIGFIFSPFNSVSLNPVILSSLLLILFVFLIFIITKTFSTLCSSALGLAGGISLFFAPAIGLVILAFGVIYSVILEEIF